ncbi:MAG: hypothetical protein JWM90_234 [Thermoleophilia bacterium]|nr:hypothetical protein [Thermoleophilia bacterium]
MSLRSLLGMLVLLVVLAVPAAAGAATATTGSATPGSTTPEVAPPASPAASAACARQSAESAKTADEVRRVRGTIRLGGCVTDSSGIAHLVISWTGAGDTHGRICTDPAVVDDVWTCTWNTARLPEGRYEVQMAAIDAAGNRGTFERTYEVAAPAEVVPPSEIQPTPDPTPSPESTPALPQTDPQPQPEPAEPGPSQPVPTEPAPAEPAPANPDTSQPGIAFSPVQRLILDRIIGCERGTSGTDQDEVFTLAEQALLVGACLEPALRIAGLVEITPFDVGPMATPALRFQMETAAQRDALRDVLPSTIAGVPVEAEVAPAIPLPSAATPSAA